MRLRTTTIFVLFTGVIVLAWPRSAEAGGYDTPILYSARHMGMGGAAVGYVDDPSALFHNPAGLGQIGRGAVLANFTFLTGTLQGSPSPFAVNEETEQSYAPLGMLGGAVRLTDWLTLGAGAFPVAQIGGRYEYDTLDGVPIEDETRLMFIEATPALALNLPGNVRIGGGWRFTHLRVDRTIGPDVEGAQENTDFLLTGEDYKSFRVGAQWTPLSDPPGATAAQRRSVQLGVSYRHETTVDVEDDRGRALGFDVTNLDSEFTLPARISGGIRADYKRFGIAGDFEWAFQGQNDESIISGEIAGMPQQIPAVFEWEDSITARGGIEYRWMAEGQLATRLGYVFDEQVVNDQYPTAFGTPPGATHSFTGGIGYDTGPFEVNVAYAYRTGTATVDSQDLEGARACTQCGLEGDYELELHGGYVDVSYEWQ